MRKYCSQCHLAFDADNDLQGICPACRGRSCASARYTEKMRRLKEGGTCPRCRERPIFEGYACCEVCLEKERRARREKLDSATYKLMRASDKPVKRAFLLNGREVPPEIVHMAAVCTRYTACGRNDARCHDCKKHHGGGECLFLRVLTDNPGMTEVSLINTCRELNQLAFGLLVKYAENTQKEQ